MDLDRKQQRMVCVLFVLVCVAVTLGVSCRAAFNAWHTTSTYVCKCLVSFMHMHSATRAADQRPLTCPLADAAVSKRDKKRMEKEMKKRAKEEEKARKKAEKEEKKRLAKAAKAANMAK